MLLEIACVTAAASLNWLIQHPVFDLLPTVLVAMRTAMFGQGLDQAYKLLRLTVKLSVSYACRKFAQMSVSEALNVIDCL